MESLAVQAISDATNSSKIFCKFLSANDTGETGGHQAGIYIPHNSISLIFDTPCKKGENKEIESIITWQNYFDTKVRFKYYGQKTRNEYRITHFGRGFPFLQPEYTGALFILLKLNNNTYKGYILNTDDEITYFLDYFGISSTETNQLIEDTTVTPNKEEHQAILSFVQNFTQEFPSSDEMALQAQNIQNRIYNHLEYIQTNPDQKLLEWISVEYNLFKAFEQLLYGNTIKKGFHSVEEFITIANQVINRRKSRAGKSLEHHLCALFKGNNVNFTSQGITEGKKKPDFIFPSEEAYHEKSFSENKLTILAAKTTCKDRWRQILNEADRVRNKNKFLCTIQQGISKNQLKEMSEEKVILVVPENYITFYPKEYQSEIWSIKKFIQYVKELENS